MKYDFDKIIDRSGTASEKWNVKDGELPMWVADMDFEAAPEIIEAMQTRLSHGVFGYNHMLDEWYDAYINWWKTRHDFEIEKDWILFSTGVLASLSSAVRRFSSPAERVIVFSPVYNHFYSSIENNGRVTVECKLMFDGKRYRINYMELEELMAHPQATMLILCNPHNPTGNIWSKTELEKIGDLAEKYGVLVISDEIHCDITSVDSEYVPYASVNDKCKHNSITLVAPTKAFNLAGLQTSAIITPNELIRNRIKRAINTDEVAEPNAFAQLAAITAFTKGADWLDELRSYIDENKKFVTDYIKKQIPMLTVVESKSTYLMWINVRNMTYLSAAFCADLREQTGLFVSAGTQYRGDGDQYLRLNVACPKERVKDGLMRLEKYVLSKYAE